MNANKSFWKNLYQSGDTGWDIGAISTPLQTYFDQIENKEIKILIPGCGHGYEGEYLYNHGFSNIYLMDLAEEALDSFQNRVAGFPADNLLCEDFFEHQGQYDLIVEQTFFCAIPKEMRSLYTRKVYDLLAPSGQLVGVLFNRPMNEDRPPYGGSIKEYRMLFSPYFDIKTLKPAYNSIAPRMGSEAFMILVKKERDD